MALLDDFLEGNLLAVAALGGVALLLPKVLPSLPPPIRSLALGGLQLFLEAESEAQGGIIRRLADQALKDVLDGLSGPGSEQERKRAGEAAIERFKRVAHARSHHYGSDHHDRAARYHRHIAALQRRLERARGRHAGAKAAMLAAVSARLNETSP